MKRLLRLGVALVGLALAGCGSSGSKAATDPMAEVRNPRLSESRRAEAIDRAWRQVLDGSGDRAAVRQELKTLAWSPNWPTGLRVKALTAVLGDPDPEGVEDGRRLVRLMLPREQQMPVIRLLSETAASRGWTDAAPALVRSLSRFDPGTPDTERPEYRALAALSPGMPVDRAVLEVFVHPPAEEGGYGVSTVARVRGDAWDVLARLDPTGSLRATLLEGQTEDADILGLRACLSDLRAAPRTGEELRWLRSLRDPGKAENASWWVEASAAIAAAGTERAPKLQMRHAEVIRWASKHRANWARASREELLGELRGRLAGRTTHQRTAHDTLGDRSTRQTLDEWRNTLTWADLLTILVLDDAVRDPAVVEALFAQAVLDREDGSAEYGGVVEAMPTRSGDGAARVVLYPPRPGSRRGDLEFVASSDMIEQGDRCLAHYHFHVQQVRNSEFAGPSRADLTYAERMGRNCLVLTSVGDGLMNVDYYQPGGATIDLGDIRRR
jgi:hypothetical protein